MRIARALASAGVDSRRKCEAYVAAGEVRVNGEIVTDLGRQVDPETDSITLRGRQLRFEPPVYYLLNKPAGYTTTASDPHAAKTVFALLPGQLCPRTGASRRGERRRVFPVGRLDRDSTGLLFFTSDGDLAQRLAHPRYGLAKWYEVRLNRALRPEDAEKLLKGVRLEDGRARAEALKPVTRRTIHVMLREGRKREIRRMFSALDYKVQALCRFAYGPLRLGNLPPGQGRFLNKREVAELREAAQEAA